MDLWSRVQRRTQEKAASSQLRHEMQQLTNELRQMEKAQNLKPGAAKYNESLLSLFNAYELVSAKLSAIEHHQAIRRAIRWQVPVPSHKMEGYADEWTWHNAHHQYYLNSAGIARIRRECYLEMEMRFKPWLSWIAVCISVVSLLVAIFKT